jgi:hypothetical protein
VITVQGACGCMFTMTILFSTDFVKENTVSSAVSGSGVFTGRLVGVQPPHDRTDENFQHRILHGLFSSLCYICSIVGTVAFDKYYNY